MIFKDLLQGRHPTARRLLKDLVNEFSMHLHQGFFAQEVHYFVDSVCTDFIKSAVTLGFTNLLEEFINVHGGPAELEV